MITASESKAIILDRLRGLIGPDQAPVHIKTLNASLCGIDGGRVNGCVSLGRPILRHYLDAMVAEGVLRRDGKALAWRVA